MTGRPCKTINDCFSGWIEQDEEADILWSAIVDAFQWDMLDDLGPEKWYR